MPNYAVHIKKKKIWDLFIFFFLQLTDWAGSPRPATHAGCCAWRQNAHREIAPNCINWGTENSKSILDTCYSRIRGAAEVVGGGGRHARVGGAFPDVSYVS